MYDNEADESDAPAERASEGKMDDAELRAAMGSMLGDCVTYVDTELSADRALATDYYKGKPFGNEEEGRSQVVLTEVRDGIQGVLPSLLRVFHGPERVVEFVPRGPNQVAGAKQASDYVQYVYVEDNGGFLITHSALKDGLLKKLGVAKWGWDDTTATRAHKLENVTQAQLELLGGDPDVELTRVERTGIAPAQPAAPGQPAPPPEALHTVELTRTNRDGRARVFALPPEEFLCSRSARSLDEALVVAHRTQKTRSELIAMGVDEKDIDAHGGPDSALAANVEEIARQDNLSGGVTDEPAVDEATDKIMYCEAYPYLDYDGDDIAELRKVCTIGPGYYPVSNEPADERPFATFCPDPEPHALIGNSWADRLMDMQRIKSFVLRSTLDSLSLSLNPRTAILEGKVNVQDAMNTDLGAIIRTREIGAVQPFVHPFVGGESLPILQMLDEIVERRTGQNKGTLGLDADALQSTGKEGVDAAISSSQAQTELLARVFAEQFLKPLFRGLLRLLVTHQPEARMVRLRDEWVQVDPRVWDADMDVTVNVALGSTLVEQKVQTLMGIAQEQKDILSMLGPSNPLVGLDQYRATLARIAELRGFKDTASFFKPVPPGWQPPPPPPAQPPQMDPADAAKIQLDAQRAQMDMQMKQAELQFKMQQAQADEAFRQAELMQQLQLEREKMASAQQIALEQLKVTSATELQIAEARLALEHERTLAMQASDEASAARDAMLKHEADQTQAHRDHQLALVEQERTEREAARELEHERAMAKIQATAQEKAKPEPAPAPAPAEPIKVEIHNHLPSGNKKVVRDKEGRVTGIADDEGKK